MENATDAVEHTSMQADSLLQVLLQTVALAVIYALRKYLKDAARQVRPEAPLRNEERVLGEAPPHAVDGRPPPPRPAGHGARGGH